MLSISSTSKRICRPNSPETMYIKISVWTDNRLMAELSPVKLPSYDMPLDLTDDKSTLVQVIVWCRQATRHYLSQFWTRNMLPYGVTRLQCVNSSVIQISMISTVTSVPLNLSFHMTSVDMKPPTKFSGFLPPKWPIFVSSFVLPYFIDIVLNINQQIYLTLPTLNFK